MVDENDTVGVVDLVLDDLRRPAQLERRRRRRSVSQVAEA